VFCFLLQVEVMHNGAWLEILGCGIVHEQLMANVGLGHRVGWAFGLGLERLAMILFDVPDIRLFWSTDPRWTEQFDGKGKGQGDGGIVKFKPFSRYPPVFKDCSFWSSADAAPLHDNDFAAVVRECAGDLVETVTLTDEFTHPKTGKSSKCYRLTYRSMERNLTNEEVNELDRDVRAALVAELDIELRE
jgi:phenylalanyl-tRNA synthetase alpha chain